MLPEMIARVTGRKAGEKGKGSREKHKEADRGSWCCVHLSLTVSLHHRDSPDHDVWRSCCSRTLAVPVCVMAHSESECIKCVSASLSLHLSSHSPVLPLLSQAAS